MILDYIEKTHAFVLKVEKGEMDPKALMEEHGLDYAEKVSDNRFDVMMTREAYAAAIFANVATERAAQVLRPITSQVELSRRIDSNAHIRCPADQELWGFQKANVEYALGRKNTLVGDQPGLGKTPTAICLANEINAKRVLVICPANIRLQWNKFIRQWSTMRWPYVVYPILSGGRGVSPTAQWTIVSYDLARTAEIGAALARGTYDLLILDEAHYVKTSDSGRTRAIFGDHTGAMREAVRDGDKNIVGYRVLFEALASRCGAIIALTGTPLPNRPREAYTLARGLCFDSIDWMSEERFKDRFNPSYMAEKTVPLYGADGRPVLGSNGRQAVKTVRYTVEKAGRHGELQNRLRANFMTRHMKREVLTQLKMPEYDVITLEPNAAIRQALEAESLLDIDPEDETLFKHKLDSFGGDIARVRHMMGVAKAPLVADHIEMLLDGGEDKLVVFGWHVEVLNILERRLGKKWGIVRIDGTVGALRKQLLVDRFVGEAGVNLLLANMQSAGTGTDGLQKVSCHALFAECSWVPGENQQCVDRLDRGGQTRTVQADFLVAPKSIDERVLASSLTKVRETDKVLDRRGW